MDKKYNGLPIGFSMSLSMNKNAMEYYALLPFEEQKRINDYIVSSNTGIEAKSRIKNVMTSLENRDINLK